MLRDFRVLPRSEDAPVQEPEPFVGLLRPVNWDDYGVPAAFHLSIALADQIVRAIGLIKITRQDGSAPKLGHGFSQLGPEHCSLGQTLAFYDNLEREAGVDAERVLLALRDLTLLPATEREALVGEEAIERTLLRFSSARHAYGIRLGLYSSRIHFRFSRQLQGFAKRHDVDFDFDRERMLARMMVLVGENGCGKTQLLSGLAYPALGIFEPNLTAIEPVPAFSRVIALSFGAFDRFPVPRVASEDFVVPYFYCGLRRRPEAIHGPEKVDVESAFQELERLHQTLIGKRREVLWNNALEAFGFRPPSNALGQWMRERSAGQAFICFVLTMLLAHIEPGALVLFDEPELHTHPKMLSTLMQQLSLLLREFDAFAIVATHSPIVVQEVPARQVRVLRSEGEPWKRIPWSSKYGRESLAESLDEIVKSGFGLDIPDTNYIKRIRELVREHGADAVASEFPHAGLNMRLALQFIEQETESV